MVSLSKHERTRAAHMVHSSAPKQEVAQNTNMLWALVILLLLLWLGGFTLNVAGGLIHLLLVLAIIVAIYNLVVTRGRAI